MLCAYLESCIIYTLSSSCSQISSRLHLKPVLSLLSATGLPCEVGYLHCEPETSVAPL